MDRLPLAAQVRALELAPLEWLAAQLRRAISPNGGSEWFRGGVLLAFFVGLTVLTFFVLTLPSMALLKVRPLSNGVVILASVLLIGALAYGWYLLVVLQLLQDTQWLSMAVMATLGVAALKLIEDQVSENRCPYCHVMDQVETVEHEHGPSQHRTEQRTRDVHVGRDVKEYERTRLDGERVKVRETTDHYERRAYDQKVTDRSFTIHRACRACQRGWAIHGKTTVHGHV